MHCDEVRTILLDYGWDAAERQRAASLLRHLDTCDACQLAFADYDALRHALRPTDGSSSGTSDGADPEPPRGWDAFLEKVNPGSVSASNDTLRLRPRPSGGRAAALAAACVLLAAGAFVVGRQSAPTGPAIAHRPVDRPTPSTGTTNHAPAPAEDTLLASLTPSPDDARRQAAAFERVSEVYDGKAGWLMTSASGASDVGLADEASPAAAGRKLLMLRLALLHAGAVASNADVAIVPGQSANLTLPMADGRSLKYRIGTSAGEPTELTLWLEVQSPRGGRGETLAALATSLRVRPGERVTAGELATTAGKYELKVGFTQATADAAAPVEGPSGRAKGGSR